MALTSAVIDRRSSEALLALAFKEGLVWTTEETDGVFERMCQGSVDSGMQAQLLEQLVLTPKLSMCGFDPNVWRALDGPLKHHLANLDAPDEDGAPIQPLPIEMISGLMGKEITEKAMSELVSRMRATIEEERQYEATSGKKAPDIDREEIRELIAKRVMRNSLFQRNYSEAEIESQRRRNAVYREFSPVVNAMQEYARLAKIADKFGLLVRTPILNSTVPGPSLTPTFDPSKIDAEVAIFRIVAHQLGRTTYRPTLAGSLKLADHSATKALREMLPLWYTRLAEGDAGELQRLQSEISQASTALESLSDVRTLGKVTTWLALPVAAVELFLAAVPIVSTTVSLAGFLGWRKDEQVSKRYHWASYGGT